MLHTTYLKMFNFLASEEDFSRMGLIVNAEKQLK